MSDDTSALREAVRMLEVFGSVGARRFDLTLTDPSGRKVRFRRGVSLDNLRGLLPDLLDDNAREAHNIIVRPVPPPVFLQLDDLDAAALGRVQPAAFVAIETSPGNHQAWLAMPETGGKDFASRVRKGAGADPTASGATRIAGSLNCKAVYAPDYPQVRILHSAPGLLVTPEQLVASGLVAPPEPPAPPRVPAGRARPSSAGRGWPDYQRCLDGAPPKRDRSGPDVSRADYTWCLIALTWGWSIEETAARLLEESAKARANGAAYANRTAQQASLGLARRQSPRSP